MADGLLQQDNQSVDSYDDPATSRQLQRVSPLLAGPQPRSLASRLEDAGNESMNVDGSSTPVEFENGPSTTDEIWSIDAISFMAADTEISAAAAFFALSALTNGIDLEIWTGASPSLKYAIVQEPIMTTGDLYGAFPKERFTHEVKTAEKTYLGTLTFKAPIRLFEANTDIIRATVNDNLTGLIEMQMTMHGQIESTRD